MFVRNVPAVSAIAGDPSVAKTPAIAGLAFMLLMLTLSLPILAAVSVS